MDGKCVLYVRLFTAGHLLSASWSQTVSAWVTLAVSHAIIWFHPCRSQALFAEHPSSLAQRVKLFVQRAFYAVYINKHPMVYAIRAGGIISTGTKISARRVHAVHVNYFGCPTWDGIAWHFLRSNPLTQGKPEGKGSISNSFWNWKYRRERLLSLSSSACLQMVKIFEGTVVTEKSLLSHKLDHVSRN